MEAERHKNNTNNNNDSNTYCCEGLTSPVITTNQSHATFTGNNSVNALKTPQSVHAITPASHFTIKVATNNSKKGQAPVVHKRTASIKPPRQNINDHNPKYYDTSSNNNNIQKVVALMAEVHKFPCHVSEECIHDTPAEVARQIQQFLRQYGISRHHFCTVALRGVNRKSLRRFLITKKTNCIVYGRAWTFMERLRLFRGEPKSLARLSAERTHPQGLPF